VQTWNAFDKGQRYRWAYKWNGIKAKMLCTDRNNTYLWPDADQISVIDFVRVGEQTPSEQLDRFYDLIRNVCIQVELMQDYMVIVDVIAASFYDEIYSSEPCTTVSVLRELHRVLGTSRGTRDTHIRVRGIVPSARLSHNGENGTYSLRVQRFYDSHIPDSFDTTLHDGFIILQNNITVKWKYPTVDVKYLGTDSRLLDRLLDTCSPSVQSRN